MDIIQAAMVVLVFCCGAMLAGHRLVCTGSTWLQLLTQSSVLAIAGLYFCFVWNRPWLTRYLPHSALIVLVNWHAVTASFFAGAYLSTVRVGRVRRLLVGTSTLMLAAYSIVAPVLGEAPVCQPQPSSRLLLTQTTDSTCSAAAAASLLRLYGINATEAEMARLCLTRRGTHWLGVYRGLKLMTRQTPWDVAAQPFSEQAVMSLGNSPALLSINTSTSLIGRDEYSGFRPDTGHSVVILDGSSSEMLVFDPAPQYGIEFWNKELLLSVSDGVILRLVSRSPHEDGSLIEERIRRAADERNKSTYLRWNRREQPAF